MAGRSSRNFRTKDLANRLGMNEKRIRRYLRSMPEYDDGAYTRYEWPASEFVKIAKEIQTSRAQKTSAHKTTVTSKGQLVIPAAVRQRYQIRKGTNIHIEELDEGILLKPITDQSIERVRGILKGKDLPQSIEKEPDREIE